ncbi:hypothetical protein ACEWY4_006165 [Coilia grayii]|uniref:DDE Tnp4 domain-containing protein n=1 Tax=Coilia grayii TaxID=363190 RepID=A0ABD1KCW1_9TELE
MDNTNLIMNRRQKTVIAALLYMRRMKSRRKHRYWVHPVRLGREQHGQYRRLVLELWLDNDLFQQYFRLSSELFDELLAQVARHPFLAGNWSCSAARYLSSDWLSVAEGFRECWNFPNCVGSIDGKHVIIQAPDISGSLYFNYKGTYSIVLLAVVDANYLFRVVDVGGYGRTSNGGTLYNSAFGEGLRDGTLDLPEDAPSEGHSSVDGYRSCLLGMRLSPSAGTSCGLSLWRMYRRVISANPATAEVCVKPTCVLHNYLQVTTLRRKETSAGFRHQGEGGADDCLQGVSRMGANNATREALRVRAQFASYFNQEGAVSWQVQP